MNDIETWILENNYADSPILLADGFEEAFIGIITIFNNPIALYDADKCIAVLIERDGMSEEEAIEYFDFNVTGAYVGENTTAFLVYKYSKNENNNHS